MQPRSIHETLKTFVYLFLYEKFACTGSDLYTINDFCRRSKTLCVTEFHGFDSKILETERSDMNWGDLYLNADKKV